MLNRAPESIYNEIHQTSSLKFSFCAWNEDESQCEEFFYPVKCRDFLGDYLYVNKTDHPAFSLYAFHVGKQEIPVEDWRLVITGDSIEIQRVSDYYKKYICPNDIVHRVDNNTLIISGESSRIWYSNTVTMSLWTLMIRCLGYGGSVLGETKLCFSKVTKNKTEFEYIQKIGVAPLNCLIKNIRSFTTEDIDVTGRYYNNKLPGGIYELHNTTGVTSVKNPGCAYYSHLFDV